MRELKLGFDPMATTAHENMPKDTEWADKVCMPEMCAYTNKFAVVTATHMGGTEAIAVLRGSMAIIGIPYDKVAGEDFAAKRGNIYKMTIDDITSLVKEGGGWAKK